MARLDGQTHLPGASHEQRYPHLLPEPSDLHAEWRLSNVYPLRRTAEMAFFGDGYEVAQLASLHDYSAGRI